MFAAIAHGLRQNHQRPMFLEGRLRFRVVMRKREWRPRKVFWRGLNIHSLDGYDVRGQFSRWFRDHLSQDRVLQKAEMKLATVPFRRLARKV